MQGMDWIETLSMQGITPLAVSRVFLSHFSRLFERAKENTQHIEPMCFISETTNHMQIEWRTA